MNRPMTHFQSVALQRESVADEHQFTLSLKHQMVRTTLDQKMVSQHSNIAVVK